MTSHFTCPRCGARMTMEDKRFACPNGHSYDRAASGYVNLFLNRGPSAKRHGDDKRMIRARTQFLAIGAYRALSDKLVALSTPLLHDGDIFLDAGCGEGHYIALLAERLQAEYKHCTLLGIDLSKEALTAAAKRKLDIALAVASVFHMPVEAQSVSLLWNVFAPMAEAEYRRVLKPGGVLLRVFPLEEHLMGLKEQLYDTVYPNRPIEPEVEGLQLLDTHYIRETLELTTRDTIDALFQMTPYYYKTGAADQEKLARLKTLTTPIAFGISVYRKPE